MVECDGGTDDRYASGGLEEDLNNVIGNLETAAVLLALLGFEFWDQN